MEAAGWSIDHLSRTAQTSSIASDLFVRGLVPGRFFAYQFALVTPSDSALQALTDALGAQATLTDGTHQGRNLLSTDARGYARSAHRQRCDALRQGRRERRDARSRRAPCSDNVLRSRLGACVKLPDDLSAAWNANVARPDFGKVQAGTDPAWSLTMYQAAPVSLLNDGLSNEVARTNRTRRTSAVRK